MVNLCLSCEDNKTYLGRNLRVFRLVEALRGLVPVGSDTLAGQLYFVFILLYDFAETEVCDLHLTIVEDDVLGLQVVVDDLLLLVIQVLETRQDLRDDELRLFLLNLLVFLEVVVEVGPAT